MAGREERRGRTVEQKLWHSIKLSGSPLRESARMRGGIAPCLSPPILRNLREEKKNYFANNKITKIKRKRQRVREREGERTVGRQEPPPVGRHCYFVFCLSVELFQGHFFVITQFLFTAKNITRRTGNSCCCCWRKSTTTNCKKICVVCLSVCVCCVCV